MPLEGFYCPDGEKVQLEDCLKECRLGERCLTLPTLVSISREREWSGVASTTQLLNGTMLEFLKLTQSYYIDPDSRAFMLSGSKHHRELEQVAKDLGLAAEIPMSIDRDIFDLIEFEGKELILTDYKLWGSFRIAQALGIVECGKVPDPSGEVYKSSGKWGKAGTTKMVSAFTTDPARADNIDAELQLNRYRVMLEELGIRVDGMRLQVTVRDGGLYIAKNRGVYRNTYKIGVRKLDNDAVRLYFTTKEMNLRDALAAGEWNMPCTVSESWDGIRCARFCEVAQFCPKGQVVADIGVRYEN